MSTAHAVEPATSVAAAGASRVVSIDIFRGLTMAVMIFVNALADGAHGLPWWTYHAHADWDVMTYVDMVFPFFLFIVGMAVPLSVEQRLKRDPSPAKLWLHVALRTLSLLVLGLILANAEKADDSLMAIGGNEWALLGLISAGLYLNVYPKSRRFPSYAKFLRAAGLIGIVVTFAIFRRTTPSGHVAWIDFSYPEILGLIAFAYLAVAILYIPTRRWRWAAPFWFVLLVALNAGCTARAFGLPVRLPIYFWPFDNGAHACIVMAGVITSQIFLGLHPGKDGRPAAKSATMTAIVFAAIAFVAGWIAIPLGISKIRATPTWSLWSIAAAVLVFTLLFWVCDQYRRTAWAFLLRPAGSNTLLTYLLPDLWAFLFGALGIVWLDTHFKLGWQGVVKTLAFTVLMLALSWVLTRAKLRLQL
jgi:heparan-alpha-glucosaminide N-acetyltransferase